MDAKTLFQTLFEPLGIAPRVFAVDYIDANNNCFHAESILVGQAGDGFIITEIKKDYAAKGFIVYSIIELPDESTLECLAKDMGVSRDSIKNCMRPVYLDSAIEKQTRSAGASRK